MPVRTSRPSAASVRCARAFLLSGLFGVLIWGLAASAELFAQDQARLRLPDGLDTMQAPLIPEEGPVFLSPAQAGRAEAGEPECQTHNTGERCAHSAADFVVDSSGSEDVTVVYDTGRNPAQLIGIGSANDIMAQRYDVPAGTRLSSVLVAPVYENQAQPTALSSDAPRDFTLKIWDVGGSGLPGDELYSIDVDENIHEIEHIITGAVYLFRQVDFPAEEEALASLPDRIFIGLENKGSDRNYLLFSPSPRNDAAPDDAAYWYTTLNSVTRWYALADVPLGGESSGDQVFPIRPRFLTVPDSGYEETIVSYHAGKNGIHGIYIDGGAEDIAVSAYDVPPESRLVSVAVAPSYDNQFFGATVPDGSPRDFTLKIWDAADDGLPGDELYSMDVEETPIASHRPFGGVYSFLHIGFAEDEAVFSTLPDRILIGLANRGDDRNYLSFAVSERKSDVPNNLAYLYAGGHWSFLSDLELEGGRSLSNMTFPMQVRFFTKTATVSAEPVAELPSAAELAQNYPNPFNPATSISWTQPAAGRVRLSAYDVLGRQAGVLADGLHPAGRHEVRLDASGWPSGAYVYVLETETRVLTRRMVLLK